MLRDPFEFNFWLSQYPSIEELNLESKRTWIGTNKHWFLQEKVDGSQLSFQTTMNEEGHIEINFWNKRNMVKKSNSVFYKTIAMITEIKERFNPKLRSHG